MSPPLPSFAGTWQMLRAELAGDAAPDEMAQKTTLELSADAYSVRFGGSVVDRGTLEVTGAAEAYALVLRGSSGPNAGRTIPCLFQVRGDRLRVCFGVTGIAPTEFATSPQQPHYLATYRRV